jgi:hypothetical protein
MQLTDTDVGNYSAIAFEHYRGCIEDLIQKRLPLASARSFQEIRNGQAIHNGRNSMTLWRGSDSRISTGKSMLSRIL